MRKLIILLNCILKNPNLLLIERPLLSPLSPLQKDMPEAGYCAAIAPIAQAEFHMKKESEIHSSEIVVHP